MQVIHEPKAMQQYVEEMRRADDPSGSATMGALHEGH
jgi:pantothenate synthetase